MTAIVVENGTGLSTADSYMSITEATNYHNNRGNADGWDNIDDKDAALRLATDYIEQTYRGRWGGRRYKFDQALDWPRVDVPWKDSPRDYRPYDVIPAELKNACAELALRTYSGALKSDLGRETIEETVDVITVKYAQGTARQTEYAIVDGWLKSLLKGAGSMISLVRS